VAEPLRVTAGDDWIELRSVDDLTWADQEVWDSMMDNVRLETQRKMYDPETGQRRTVISEDGLTQVPLRVVPEVTAGMANKRRDDLLTALITGWSFTDRTGRAFTAADLPFTPDVKPSIPLRLGKALDRALVPYYEALQDTGPKEKTEPSSTSGSSSKARQPTSRKA